MRGSVLGADFRDMLPDQRGTGEGDEVDIRAAGQIIANLDTQPRHHVVGPGWYPGIGHDLGKQQGQVRRHFRGQVHHGVSHRQCIANQPRGLDQRDVERCDHGDHAQGIPHGHGELSRRVRRYRLTAHVAAQPGCGAHHGQALVELEHGLLHG